jgi:hypothetical protein
MTDDVERRPAVADFHADLPGAEGIRITGYARGDCLYLVDTANDDAWLEGRAVCLGDME